MFLLQRRRFGGSRGLLRQQNGSLGRRLFKGVAAGLRSLQCLFNLRQVRSHFLLPCPQCAGTRLHLLHPLLRNVQLILQAGQLRLRGGGHLLQVRRRKRLWNGRLRRIGRNCLAKVFQILPKLSRIFGSRLDGSAKRLFFFLAGFGIFVIALRGLIRLQQTRFEFRVQILFFFHQPPIVVDGLQRFLNGTPLGKARISAVRSSRSASKHNDNGKKSPQKRRQRKEFGQSHSKRKYTTISAIELQ